MMANTARSRERFSRRAFLKATGISPFLLPLLEPRLARAGCLTGGPKRAVFVVWPNGSLPANDRNLWPAAGATESDFVLSAPLQSLAPFKQDLIFLDRLKYQFINDTPLGVFANRPELADGHSATPGLLTGRKYASFTGMEGQQIAGGPSIDQHLGGDLVKRGFRGIPSLHLGVRIHLPIYSVWRAAGEPVAPYVDPAQAFNAVFAAGAPTALDPELERTRRTRKSVLDFVQRDLGRFARTLGTADRFRIEGHLESVRAIEKQLLTGLPPLAGACRPSWAPEKFDMESSANIPRWLKTQMDILVAAMAADVVRVAVLQFADGQGETVYPTWLFGPDSAHFHRVKHEAVPGALQVDTWFYSQWAYLIGRLKSDELREGDKYLLDNSVVAFMNNMSIGPHAHHDVPAFLAGSCGGYFKTGRCVQNRSPGGYHPPLLVSIANAMGVPIDSWGDAAYNSGAMPGLRA